MNIQFAEEYKNAEKRETERGFLEQSEPGLERGRTLGAGAREKESEPGARTRRWSRSRGPREERCSKEYEHEEEEGLKRTWHKVIRVMYMQRLRS